MNRESEIEPRCSWADGDHYNDYPYNDKGKSNPLTKPLPYWFFDTIREMVSEND